MNEKEKIRIKMRNLISNLTSEEKLTRSHNIVRKIKNLIEFKQAESIMFYYPLPGEVNILSLLEYCFQKGKKVLLPYVVSIHPPKMELAEIWSLSEVEEGELHTLEPWEKKAISISTVDLFICPGLAFDLEGNRLGRGKAFFDYFFHQYNQVAPAWLVKRIGVCFQCQVVNKLPVDQFDQKVTKVVTEEKIITF
jgi:5-formyltetrahydrofolate cyclo-ligase